MKPIIFYVDDEPHNLTVFEAAMPDDWEVKTFTDPMQALDSLESIVPSVIVADQRMPSISGVRYLELARKIHPNAVRIIVTGYSEEDLVIESVRKAQVFDYIRKPWEPEELETAVKRAIDFYKMTIEREALVESLRKREAELEETNKNLTELTMKLEQSREEEKNLRQELECWVPPFVIWALNEKSIEFPLKKNIVGITFDIINSAKIHGIEVQGKPLRGKIIELFSEAIIRNGGWRESHSGDSAYGHFGVINDIGNPCEAALAVASEFRVGLRNLANLNKVEVECGVAIQICKDSLVDIHSVQISTPKGNIQQKSFDTTSKDIDLLHRMEKLVHSLPGSNVILSSEVLSELSNRPANILELGFVKLKGQDKETELFLIPSDKASKKDLDNFRESLKIEARKSA